MSHPRTKMLSCVMHHLHILGMIRILMKLLFVRAPGGLLCQQATARGRDKIRGSPLVIPRRVSVLSDLVPRSVLRTLGLHT